MPEKAIVTSAIYVDFDNVYITLNEQHSEELSDLLVRYAGAWLHSLEDGEDGGPRRRFLIKRCYMNIDRYARQMREGGFDVTLCPSLTRQGKSAVDIQMAMDIIEECLVSSCEAPIEEFIILSNDADFAPVLKKLRRNNRDSTILELGNISSAYRHMADKTITNLPQILQRLAGQEENSLVLSSASRPSAPKPSTPKSSTPKSSASRPSVPKPSAPRLSASKSSTPKPSTSKPSAPKSSTPKPSAPKLKAQMRSRCAALIRNCASNNNGRVKLNKLKSELRDYFEGEKVALPWSKQLSFKDFLHSLPLQSLTILDSEVVSAKLGAAANPDDQANQKR